MRVTKSNDYVHSLPFSCSLLDYDKRWLIKVRMKAKIEVKTWKVKYNRQTYNNKKHDQLNGWKFDGNFIHTIDYSFNNKKSFTCKNNVDGCDYSPDLSVRVMWCSAIVTVWTVTQKLSAGALNCESQEKELGILFSLWTNLLSKFGSEFFLLSQILDKLLQRNLNLQHDIQLHCSRLTTNQWCRLNVPHNLFMGIHVKYSCNVEKFVCNDYHKVLNSVSVCLCVRLSLCCNRHQQVLKFYFTTDNLLTKL